MKVKNDAEVRLKVSTDSSASEKGINNLNNQAKDTPKYLDKIQSVGATVFKSLAVGIGTASTALGGLVMKSVTMAGELEQNVGGAEAVFKELGKEIKDMQITFKNSDGSTAYFKSLEAVSLGAYRTMGLAQSDYLATVNKMGSLMQGAGLDTQKSLQLSSEAMQRAADVASVMGIDINMAMDSIAGAAKGNFTMMDNLGVAMNDTTLQAYALEKGINKSTSAMTNAEKIELAMQMFLEKTQKMAGNYAKENETFAGSFQTLKASISNFLSGADDIEPVIESLMSFSDILIKSIAEMAPKVIEGIIGLINGIIPQLSPLLQKLLPIIITGAVDLIKGLVQALPQLIPVLMDGIVQAFMGIVEILPQLLEALIQASIMIIGALADQLPVLIPAIIEAILQMIPMLIDNLPLFIKAGYQLLIGIMKGLIQSVPILISYIPKIISSIINYWKKVPSMMKDIGGNLIKGLWNGISNVKQWLLNKISGIGSAVMNKVKSIFGVHSPSTEFHWIGEMDMVGLEEGFEDKEKDLHKTIEDTIGIDYLKNGTYNVSGQFFSTPSNAQNNYIINIENNMDMDVNKFGKAFVREVKTFSGGSKNDYNY